MTRARCNALLAEARVSPSVSAALPRGPAEDVAQDQHGTLAWRQVLHGHDEGQLDRLPGDNGLVRVVVGELTAREGLQVEHLRPRFSVVRGQRNSVTALVQEVQARVGGDAIQPGAQRGPTLERLPAGPRPQERLLSHVLGVVVRRQHAVAVHVQLAPEPLREQGKATGIAGAGHLHELGLVGADRSVLDGAHSPHPPPVGWAVSRGDGSGAGNASLAVRAAAMLPGQ